MTHTTSGGPTGAEAVALRRLHRLRGEHLANPADLWAEMSYLLALISRAAPLSRQYRTLSAPQILTLVFGGEVQVDQVTTPPTEE